MYTSDERCDDGPKQALVQRSKTVRAELVEARTTTGDFAGNANHSQSPPFDKLRVNGENV
jgi:hypothetical protein